MRNFLTKTTWCGLFLAICLVAARQALSEEKPLPPFEAIKTTVQESFAREPDYKPGDMISKKQVTAVLAKIAAAGWEVGNAAEILQRVPDDKEFMVTQLRTAQGRKLMRQVARLEHGYDKLERLTQLPDGRQIMAKLVKGPDGHKLIEYMTATKGGKELQKMLERTPKGGNFSDRTGKIYTADQLVEELATSYQAAIQ